MRFKTVGTVHFLYIQNNKLLMHRRLHTGYMDGWYSVPAGHIEEDEPPSIAMCREVAEEVGLILKPEEIKPVHFMYRKEGDIRFDTFWSPLNGLNQDPKNCEPDKCDDIHFFSLDHLPENTIPYIRYAVDQTQSGVAYSEFGWA